MLWFLAFIVIQAEAKVQQSVSDVLLASLLSQVRRDASLLIKEPLDRGRTNFFSDQKKPFFQVG